MCRLFVAMTTLTALAVVLHSPPRVSAAIIDVNIGSVTWFLGSGTSTGTNSGRGHAAQFTHPQACAFTNNGSLLIADRDNNKIRRVVQPRDDLVENWMGNGTFADVNGVGTAACYTEPVAIAVMANNTFAFVVEGNAISRIDVAASLKSAFVGMNFIAGIDDGSGTAARFNQPACITIFHATTTLFVGEFPRIRQVTFAGDTSGFSGSSSFFGSADGDSFTARYLHPQGITTAQSSLILFVTDDNAIRRVDNTGTCLTLAGFIAGYVDGPAATARFDAPSGIVLDKYEQSLYIADTSNAVVRRLDLATLMVFTVIGTVGSSSWTSAPISYNAKVVRPAGLCIDPVSQRLFVTGANSLSFAEMYTLSASASASVTQTPSLTDTASAVNCDVQFCVCVGVHAGTLTALQCARRQSNCTNTRHCTARYELCVVDELVPLSSCESS
jgi:DNA-binding beta-propeller fold protein YncE